MSAWNPLGQRRDVRGDYPGMTLRQYYAGQALAAICERGEPSPKYAAAMAVKYADALCEALVTKTEETE